MRLQTLSSYRLKTKAVATEKTFTAPSGVRFSIFVSNESKVISQYYVVESHWESKSKVIPLAHLQVSKTSGSVKIAALQPENWGVKLDRNELLNRIVSCLPETTTSNKILVAH